jgi:hypothetical protein
VAGGAAEGAGKGLEGVHGVGAELKGLSGSSEGDQGGRSWWLNDGKHGGAVAAKGWRRKKGCPRGCSFYSRCRRLTGGTQRFQISFNLSKTASTLKIKMGVLYCSKNSQFLHLASLGIMNNFLNCANNQFPTEIEIKILEQIQHLNL